MATKTYRLSDLREMIEIGNSVGLTIDREQLEHAEIPLGTEVVVETREDKPGVIIEPRE